MRSFSRIGWMTDGAFLSKGTVSLVGNFEREEVAMRNWLQVLVVLVVTAYSGMVFAIGTGSVFEMNFRGVLARSPSMMLATGPKAIALIELLANDKCRPSLLRDPDARVALHEVSMIGGNSDVRELAKAWVDKSTIAQVRLFDDDKAMAELTATLSRRHAADPLAAQIREMRESAGRVDTQKVFANQPQELSLYECLLAWAERLCDWAKEQVATAVPVANSAAVA